MNDLSIPTEFPATIASLSFMPFSLRKLRTAFSQSKMVCSDFKQPSINPDYP